MKETFYQDEYTETRRIICTPSEFARDHLLYLQEIGESKALKPRESKRNALESYLILCVTQGQGILKYDGEQKPARQTSYQLHAGQLALIDCRRNYSHISSADDPWTIRWLHIYGRASHQLYQIVASQPSFAPILNAEDIEMERIWDTLYQNALADSYDQAITINAAVSQIWSRLLDQAKCRTAQPVKMNSADYLDSIRSYLEQHYTETISLDQLSELFYINKFYLSRIFKSEYGITINQYLLQVRMTHAKELLRYSDQTVEEIGYATGMGAINYFSRTFKKVEGINPSEYRKRW